MSACTSDCGDICCAHCLDVAHLRAEVERLKAALRECVAFVEDDTCRHDYEKRAPLKRAREALGEVERW